MAWCHQATSHYQRQCWQDLCHNIGSSGIVVVIRLHSITWAKIYPFLCCHIVPLGHNELGHLLWDDSAFSCDQAALRTPLSVSPSIRLSVTPFYPSARIGLEGYCRGLPGRRAGVTSHHYRSPRRCSYRIEVKLGGDESWGRISDKFVDGRRGSLIKRLTS